MSQVRNNYCNSLLIFPEWSDGIVRITTWQLQSANDPRSFRLRFGSGIFSRWQKLGHVFLSRQPTLLLADLHGHVRTGQCSDQVHQNVQHSGFGAGGSMESGLCAKTRLDWSQNGDTQIT